MLLMSVLSDLFKFCVLLVMVFIVLFRKLLSGDDWVVSG